MSLCRGHEDNKDPDLFVLNHLSACSPLLSFFTSPPEVVGVSLSDVLSPVIYVFADCLGPGEQMVINMHGLQIP